MRLKELTENAVEQKQANEASCLMQIETNERETSRDLAVQSQKRATYKNVESLSKRKRLSRRSGPGEWGRPRKKETLRGRCSSLPSGFAAASISRKRVSKQPEPRGLLSLVVSRSHLACERKLAQRREKCYYFPMRVSGGISQA